LQQDFAQQRRTRWKVRLALVYELMHAPRLYAAIDWCAGVFKTPSGAQTVVVSSEGAGYIPAGVFIPRSARLLFSDSSLSDGFRARWFGWVNPAQTMLAYAALCTENDPNIELYAVAVSTDHGGSAVPAATPAYLISRTAHCWCRRFPPKHRHPSSTAPGCTASRPSIAPNTPA
jgi:hypothetical protein